MAAILEASFSRENWRSKWRFLKPVSCSLHYSKHCPEVIPFKSYASLPYFLNSNPPSLKLSDTEGRLESEMLVRRLQGQVETAAKEEMTPTPKKVFQILNQVTSSFLKGFA
ncbi:hypothetical protein U1Q18_012280 [Sarracenia purpurea var. burkii]